MTFRLKAALAVLGACIGTGALATAAQAQIFQDNSITYAFGTRFHEPYNTNDITKSWVSYLHVSGDKWGGNFFLLDAKFSDSKDPTGNTAGTANPVGASELYGIYVRTFSYNKLTGSKGGFGPIADFGWTVGGHANAKNDSFGSEKRLLTSGLYLDWAVPAGARLRTSFEVCREWNVNGTGAAADYHPTFCFNSSFGVPFTVAGVSMAFSGFYGIVAPKGESTVTEHYLGMELMADVGHVFGARKGFLEAGVRYDYWVNKFGNDHSGPAGDGAFDRVPMLLVRTHF
ncbi:MAG: hypothetical protein NW223_13145 [Hyphomicrobiaceae bacterium]|nr:hypothetical protein [Hyphomicrobiaceae bacterium]